LKKSKKSFVKVGNVLKAHGIKGEIFILPLHNHPTWPTLKEIKIGDAFFSIEKYSKHKKGLIFKLEACQNRLSAEALKGKSVFLNKELFTSQKGQDVYLLELLSFCVKVLNSKEEGVVHSFQSSSHQDFLFIEMQNKKTIQVPFVRDYIQDICFLEKKLTLNLPDNFLEIFSQS